MNTPEKPMPVIFRLIGSMKQILLAVLLVFSVILCFSQNSAPRITVEGMIADSLSQASLEYVTLTLFNQQGSEPYRATHTDAEGKFEFSKLSLDDYTLVITLIGYKTRRVRVAGSSSNGARVVSLGKISISPLANDLDAIHVNGFKPLIDQQADRLVYDVQADPESKASNALDMLRKVPLVSVDGADNIRLKGSSNYRMLINGRTSSLVANSPSDLLKSMAADNIQKIEVITTPPAKYDAEGISGIINIITQRKLSEGYSVSLTSAYNTVNGPSANVNAKGKRGKFGIQGFVGTAQPIEQTVATGYTSAPTGPFGSVLVQSGTRVHDHDNTFGSAQVSFEADSLNLFTAELEYHEGGSSQRAQQISSQQMGVNESYELLNGITNEVRGTDIGLNHEHGFKREKRQLLTSSYKYSYSRDAFSNDASYRNTLNFTAPDFLQRNKSGSKEHTGQVDYVHPFRKLEVEVGAKAILRENFSQFDSQIFDSETGKYYLDPNQTNDFNYQQDIYSLYNSYHLVWKQWDARAGVRLERSSVKADFSSAGDQITQRYTNLFPSLSVQRMLGGSNSLSLGYQERLERPGIHLLNPFEDYTNPRFVMSGNPDLEAVLNHSVDLIYSNYSKSPFTLGVGYSFANNTIEQFTEVSDNQISRTDYRNVGRRRAASLILNVNFAVTPKLNTNIDAQIMHVGLNGIVDALSYSNKGFQGHIFSNTRYRLAKGYRLGMDISYDSRYVLLQGRDNDFLYYSLNGSKDFLNDKMTLSVSSSNFFNKYTRLDFTTRSGSFLQRHFYDIYYRRFNVRLVYKFGRLNGDIKKNQRGIRNDDQSSLRSNPS